MGRGTGQDPLWDSACSELRCVSLRAGWAGWHAGWDPGTVGKIFMVLGQRVGDKRSPASGHRHIAYMPAASARSPKPSREPCQFWAGLPRCLS